MHRPRALFRPAARSARVLAVVLGALLYALQPVLAASGLACGAGACGDPDASCCCVEEPAAPADAGESCCSEEGATQAAEPEPAHDPCGCRADSTPVPAPLQALPPRTGESVGGGEGEPDLGPSAAASAALPWGPPVDAFAEGAAEGRRASALRARSRERGGGGDAAARRVLCIRGVAAFLAVMSVARA